LVSGLPPCPRVWRHRFCDDIAVFHGGTLIQRGNHDTLFAQIGGKYQELWNAQAQYYIDTKGE